MRRIAICVVLAACGDTTPPAYKGLAPAEGALDLRGVGMAEVHARVVEDNGVRARLLVDGDEVATADTETCGGDCSIDLTWDTTPIAAGTHDLELRVADDSGNDAPTRFWSAQLDDVVAIDRLELGAEVVDDNSTLEMEVYLFDAAHTMVGCAGSRQGLGKVDEGGVDYTVVSTMIDANGGALLGAHALDAVATPVHFEVWEDDDPPVCPAPLDPNGNNLEGTSPAHTVAEWRGAHQELTFDHVTGLGVEIGRPYLGIAIPSDSDNPAGSGSDEELFGPGSAGCNAGGGGGSGAWLLALGALAIARRSRVFYGRAPRCPRSMMSS